MRILLIRVFVVVLLGASNDHRFQDTPPFVFPGPPSVNTSPRLQELGVLVQKRSYGLHQKIRFEAGGIGLDDKRVAASVGEAWCHERLNVVLGTKFSVHLRAEKRVVGVLFDGIEERHKRIVRHFQILVGDPHVVVRLHYRLPLVFKILVHGLPFGHLGQNHRRARKDAPPRVFV